jgi:hypothetical protein
MQVTPRASDAIRGMAADEPRAGWGGEGRIHTSINETGLSRLAPRFPKSSGAERREAKGASPQASLQLVTLLAPTL